MTVGDVQALIPLTSAYELQPGKVYFLKLPSDMKVTPEFAIFMAQLNKQLEDNHVKVVLLDDRITIGETP